MRSRVPKSLKAYAGVELNPVPHTWIARRAGSFRSDTLQEACEIAGITLDDARREDRHIRVALRRQYVYWLLAQRGWSTPLIGQHLNRDHSTISYGIRRFQLVREVVSAYAQSRA